MAKGESRGLEICKSIRFEFKEETVFDTEVWVHTPYLDAPFRMMYGDMLHFGGTKTGKSIRIAANVLSRVMEGVIAEPSELLREFKIKFGQTPLSFLDTLKRANFKAALQSGDKEFEHWAKKICYDPQFSRNLLKMKRLKKNWELRKDLSEECYPLMLLPIEEDELEVYREITEGKSFSRNKVVVDLIAKSYLFNKKRISRLGNCSERSLEIGLRWNIPLEIADILVRNRLGGEFERMMTSFTSQPFIGGFSEDLGLIIPELTGNKGDKLDKLFKSVLAQCSLIGKDYLVYGLKQLLQLLDYKQRVGSISGIRVKRNPFTEELCFEYKNS